MSVQQSLKMVLAVDGSPHSQAAARLAAGAPWPAGNTATVLAVVPERWSFSGLTPEAQSVLADTLAGLRRTDRIAAEGLAAQVAGRLRAHNLTTTVEVREGRPSEVILQCAAELPADLIVIGAKGLSAPDAFWLGSTAHKVAHYAECSVLVVRPSERAQPLSVILAADGSPEAQRAAEFLCALSLPHWAEVTVVGVAEFRAGVLAEESSGVANVPEVARRVLLEAAEACVAEAVERLRGCGAHVASAIYLGHPAKEILSAAQEQDADLIAVGARGLTRAEPFRLGGVAQKVVKYAPCSVLVVR